MRVMHIIPTLGVGGAERMVTSLARHQRANGHAVSVVSMYPPLGTWLERDLRDGAVEVCFLGKRRGFDVRMVPRIAGALWRFRPDVVHTHMYALKYALPGLLARRRGGVHTVHTLAARETDTASRAIHQFAFQAGVIPVAVGAAVAESVQAAYRCAPPRMVPNGIPVSEFARCLEARREIREAFGIAPDAPVFLTVARFSEPKNHDLLVRAFSAERFRTIGARLLLAGDGELRERVARQVEAAGLSHSVHFMGIRSDVARVLASADVFVLPSRVEGNPLSVMEAMAAGLPVVATAVGSLPEVVTPACGEVVPAGDVEALERAMFLLASDKELARDKGAASQRAARERFDVGTMAAEYDRLYRTIA